MNAYLADYSDADISSLYHANVITSITCEHTTHVYPPSVLMHKQHVTQMLAA